MKLTIFALAGKGGCGKTYTIKKIYEKLSVHKTFQDIDVNYNPAIKAGTDIKGTFKIAGILIGIASQGDPNSGLKEKLQDFKVGKCKIIICATRTDGGTIDDVISFRPFYQTCWDRQKYVALNKHAANNDQMADSFVHKISELLNI